MKKNYFVGIDVSKQTIDVAFIVQKNQEKIQPCWKIFGNNEQGLYQMQAWLQSNHVPFNDDTLFVIENTGLYHRLLVKFCNKHQLQLCIENGAQVKWSLGIARGKSDKIDSRRLVAYAVRFADRLKPSSVLHEGIQAVKDLITLRNRHIVQMSSLQTHLKELKATTDPKAVKELVKIHAPLIKAMRAVIKKAESAIRKKIEANELTRRQYMLLLSIPCIGPITASYLIACTNAFTTCSSGKQLACYCGVVPFEYQSGISIKGKHHVHKMANKNLKALLHLCAMSSIKYVDELRNYFNRKVEEGKNKMSIINAIRNKLALRAFSVIKNDKPFVENVGKAAWKLLKYIFLIHRNPPRQPLLVADQQTVIKRRRNNGELYMRSIESGTRPRCWCFVGQRPTIASYTQRSKSILHSTQLAFKMHPV